MKLFLGFRSALIAALAAIAPAGCALHGAVPGSAVSALSILSEKPPSLGTIYTFNGSDGSDPQGPMVEDARGDIYGAAHSEGPLGGGVAFELVKGASGYTETVLYAFKLSGSVGKNPGPLTLDADGDLWGQTSAGVVELKPSKSHWTATLVYANCAGGASENYDSRVTPSGSDVFAACASNAKVVKISSSGRGFRTTVLHKFPDNNSEQVFPNGGLVVDRSGNVLGTSKSYFGDCCFSSGPTFELSPDGSTYSYRGLFQMVPTSYGVALTGRKMFETAFYPGAQGCGHIYEAVPRTRGYHVWAILDGICNGTGAPIPDAAGDLYFSNGNAVMEIMPAEPKYRKQVLSRVSSTAQPLWMDSAGTIYGATTADGGFGSVFEINTK